jgi:crotonobetainyl-CoA:carnitine CoA-transferase CaiB-like acyl-CoA transferase
MAFPSTWSATQPQCSRPVPRLGEHSAEVLREIGYSEERIDALMRSGATATERRTEKET